MSKESNGKKGIYWNSQFKKCHVTIEEIIQLIRVYHRRVCLAKRTHGGLVKALESFIERLDKHKEDDTVYEITSMVKLRGLFGMVENDPFTGYIRHVRSLLNAWKVKRCNYAAVNAVIEETNSYYMSAGKALTIPLCLHLKCDEHVKRLRCIFFVFFNFLLFFFCTYTVL